MSEAIPAIDSQVVCDQFVSAPQVTGAELAPAFEAMMMQDMLMSTCLDAHFNVSDIDRVSPQMIALLPQSIPPVGQSLAVPLSVSEKIQTTTEVAPQSSVVSSSSEIHQTTDEFVKAVWPYIKQASESFGLDPKILLAQAALETGWGKFIAKDSDGTTSHNLFNIKSTSGQAGQSVRVKTTEYISETPVRMMASFKKYSTIEESVNDYLLLITNNKRYQSAVAQATDPTGYVTALQAAGYATDPQYADKILSIYHSDQLQQTLDKNTL